MKSLMLLTQSLLDESGKQLGICTTRDAKRIRARFEKEGLSFLTITLPDFCKGIELALAEERLVPSHLPGFRFREGLPLFLRGFLERIFESGTGQLLVHVDVDCILAIRQITRVLSKVELPTTAARRKGALRQYVSTDQDLGDLEFRAGYSRALDSISAVLFGELLAPLEQALHSGDVRMLMPKHGPGATADSLVGNQKYGVREWPRRLESVLPVGEFILPNWRYRHELESVRILEPGEERPVRVVLVPKTLKTPRVIAIEPTAMQYAQQAILGYLVNQITASDTLEPLIGLLNQEPNRILSQYGSLFGNLATLDLSEASDRVSMKLVRLVFARFPHFLEVLEATRSTHASVPVENNKREIHALNKFASMGSALCFPVEAMVFLTIIIAEMLEQGALSSLSRSSIKRLNGVVRVFGDDIIVPSDIAVDVIEGLEVFGLKVNRNKSFWTGKFRESCGKDWYEGQDVTYVKARRPFPRDIRDGEEVLSLVSLRNQLYQAGYWETCRRLDDTIVGVLPHFPIVEATSPAVGRDSVAFEPLAESIDPDLHLPMVKGFVVKASVPINSIDGHLALLKYFVSPSLDDAEHLVRSGRPASVKLRKRWCRIA